MARCMVNYLEMGGWIEAYGPGLRSLGLHGYVDAQGGICRWDQFLTMIKARWERWMDGEGVLLHC